MYVQATHHKPDGWLPECYCGWCRPTDPLTLKRTFGVIFTNEIPDRGCPRYLIQCNVNISDPSPQNNSGWEQMETTPAGVQLAS